MRCRKRTIGAVLAAMALVGCAGTGERQNPEVEEGGSRAAPTAGAHREPGDSGLRETRMSGFGSYVVHNSNYTLVVKDPREAMAKAREVVLAMGGEITNASGTEDNANLNAILPPGEHKGLRSKLADLALRVESENSGRSEYAAPIEQAKRRLARVDSARMHLVEAMRTASGRDAADALGLMMELAETEKRNLEQQLVSYREQTRGSQLYVSFMRDVPVPIPAMIEH
jgi:hypothetical protein